jgi:hypothetical protein
VQKRLSYNKPFLKTCLNLSEERRKEVDLAVSDLVSYLKTGRAAVGLGVKRLMERTWEFRVGIHTRILYIDTDTEVVIAFMGSHDDIRKYLKRH